MENDNRTIRITFTVVCDSPVWCMDLGDTFKEKIKYYIRQCTEAIECEMRHWGEFTYSIEPEKIELISDDEDGNEIFKEVNLEDDDEQSEKEE